MRISLYSALLGLLVFLPRTSWAEEFSLKTASPLDAQELNRLEQVIKETVQPEPAKRKPLSPESEKQLRWSNPVGGLAARIEAISGRSGVTAIVRLKNVSSQTLVVPTGNPKDEDAPRAFEIHVRQGDGPWRKTGWGWDPYCEKAAPDAPKRDAHTAMGVRGTPIDRPLVTLRPGEHCLAVVCGTDEEDDGREKELKVVLRRPDGADEGYWSGIVETPPRTAQSMFEQWKVLAGTLPMPDHFPRFTYTFIGISWSGSEPGVTALWHSNRSLFDLLPIYDPVEVRDEFERRMQEENRLPMKLFLAVLAARAGSEKAAILLLELMKETDYATRINLHGALERLFSYNDEEPPAWVVELSIAALSDKRLATGMERTRFRKGTSFTVSSCESGSLLFHLGKSKSRKAVPLFIDRVKTGRADWYAITALGHSGDERAVPALLEFFEKTAHSATYAQGGPPRTLFLAAYALSKLKAKDAVPVLLKYVEYPEILGDLARIGDPAAAPGLREIVAAGGKVVRNGRAVLPQRDQERLFEAKKALATWDEDGGAERLCRMFDDPSITRRQRYDLVMELGHHDDPRVVPILVRVVKTDDDHYIICMAIKGLARLKRKAAVEGLIECFDVDFKEQDFGKGERATKADYRLRIARSLQHLTGQPFGADKEAWLKWWKEEGKESGGFK